MKEPVVLERAQKALQRNWGHQLLLGQSRKEGGSHKPLAGRCLGSHSHGDWHQRHSSQGCFAIPAGYPCWGTSHAYIASLSASCFLGMCRRAATTDDVMERFVWNGSACFGSFTSLLTADRGKAASLTSMSQRMNNHDIAFRPWNSSLKNSAWGSHVARHTLSSPFGFKFRSWCL